MKRKTLIMTGLMLFLLPNLCFSFDQQHGLWDILLKKHVIMRDGGRSSRVDYNGVNSDRGLFNTYLTELSSVSQSQFDGWTDKQQLAFLINAYNAFTIDLVLKHYPVKSIKNTVSFFKSPWKVEFVPLFGKNVSLDAIEHELILKKGKYDDPRVHMAIVCASKGCPALRNLAYTAENVDSELETATINFLSDKTRNRYNPEKNRFEISQIFKWYSDDFKARYGSIQKFLHTYSKFMTADKKDLIAMNKAQPDIEFLDYDWSLNGI